MNIQRERYHIIYDGKLLFLGMWNDDESVILQGYVNLMQLRDDLTRVLEAALVD